MTHDDAPDARQHAAERAPTRAGCACIVVAGGRSRRMGRAKADLPVPGGSLLEHVVASVRPLVAEVVIVAAAAQTLPPLDARVVRDRVPDEGPLPALALGLETMSTPWAFALGCDAPFVRRAVLRLLAAEVGAARAAIPTWDGRLQPLVAIYHRALVPALRALAAAGERRLQAVATLPDVRVVPAARLAAVDPDGTSFRSLNTPAAYEDALARWEALRDRDER